MDSFLPGIWEHIAELRKRLLLALLALAATTLASFTLAEPLLHLLAVPVGGLERLQAIDVTETVGVFMRISLLAGLTLALPFIVYELLAFVMPGLKPAERRWVLTAVPLSTLLFAGGVAFAYFVMLPSALPFLVDFLGVHTVPRLSNYINFVTGLMFWIGASFQMPLVIFLLAKLHLVTAGMLARGWRVAVVVIAIIAAVITPTVDPVNMALVMLPLLGLYAISILLALLAK